MALAVLYTVFADKAVIERETGKISLIGIFQSVNPDVPIIPTMSLYYMVKGEPGSYKCKVHIRHTGPGSERLKASIMPELPVQFKIPENGLAQVLMNFVGLPVVGNRIEFDIYQEDNLINSESIPVIAIEKHAD